MISGPDDWLIPRPHKGCRLLEIAGRWSRRLKSAQECVTTHLPKRATPKTDDAQTSAKESNSLAPDSISLFHSVELNNKKKSAQSKIPGIMVCRGTQRVKLRNHNISILPLRQRPWCEPGQSSLWCRSWLQ